MFELEFVFEETRVRQRIWSFKRGETEYGIKAIPAGAYVKVIGMSNLDEVDWYRTRGASLVGIGSKVNREFLYNWVQDPKHYWEDTFMPDLRLTDN